MRPCTLAISQLTLTCAQLVVMGEQSTGKSSVLQAVTEIPFPIHDKMCTRFATEIVLRRTSPNTPTLIDVCIIPDDSETVERKKTLKEWRPEGLDPTAALGKSVMKDIFKQASIVRFNSVAILISSLQAESMIFAGTESSPSRRNHMNYHRNMNRLSTSTLRITRSGPKETDFSIVDIPGLVRVRNGGTEHQTAMDLVEKYKKNPRSIIV